MVTSSGVLTIIGHIFFFLLFIGVPPFIVTIIKELKGSKASVFSVSDWVILIVLYAVAGYLYIGKWILGC